MPIHRSVWLLPVAADAKVWSSLHLVQHVCNCDPMSHPEKRVVE
jgi:hypothetical protein